MNIDHDEKERSRFMSLQKLMCNYAGFNRWANNTIVAWLATKPVEIIESKTSSSFLTVIETLVHIWNTEIFWLGLLESGNEELKFKEGFEGTNEAALNGLLKHSAKFSDYVHSLSEKNLEELVTLDQPWMKGEQPRYEIIQHCMNHSTYHRGQIITMARCIGITDPPMTDYNYYNMVVKKATNAT